MEHLASEETSEGADIYKHLEDEKMDKEVELANREGEATWD